MKKSPKRVYQSRLWDAARLYRREAERCYKARAYFSAIVARGAELEALLRIFDFVENRRTRDRCRDFYSLINRAFARHWIPHDALHYWKKSQSYPLKAYLHYIRNARNGVHAHLFDKRIVSATIARNIGYVVNEVFAMFEIKNARNLMRSLYERGEISAAEYNSWKRKQR